MRTWENKVRQEPMKRTFTGTDLCALFNEYFEVIPANTPALKKEAFRVRYQVYCEEGLVPGFEAWRFPDGLEKDEYDDCSLHSLLYHRPSGKTAGTVRLIRYNLADPGAPLPIEKHGNFDQLPEMRDSPPIPRNQIAEISRLLLTRSFRTREGEQIKPYGVGQAEPLPGDQNARRRFPHSVFGLFVAITQMSFEHGITHWYAAMEPGLNRLLRLFCVGLQPIGPIIQYHGPRQPYFSDARQVLGNAYQNNRAIWNLLSDEGKAWPPPN